MTEDTTQLSAVEAMRAGLCRICGKRSSGAMVFDNGNEYAHVECVAPRKVETKVADLREKGRGW